MTTPFPFQSAAVLLASQLNAITTLATSTKTASHILTISDVSTRVIMNSASATTITVNTSIFGASDIVEILNIGAGVCTVTAGTCTVGTSGSLALAQNAGGTLTFISASASVFRADGVTGGGKVLQVVTATTATLVTTTSTSYVTTGLTATITPSLASSKVMILTAQAADAGASDEMCVTIFRGTVAGTNLGVANGMGTTFPAYSTISLNFLDSPNTTSAQVYTTGFKNLSGAGTARIQSSSRTSSMLLLEIGV